MNIGILIICTGRYNIFFEDLYLSCEKFFLTNHKKTYYVFTDNDLIQRENIVKINQSFLGWPYDTMKRFHMFNNSKEQLEKEDYLFFFNANMLVVDYIDETIIPDEKNNYLMGVNHPGFFGRNKNEFTYERNINSQFYIPYNEGEFYFQGCFNGGRNNEFLEMSDLLSKKIDQDLEKNIIPIWHDESALNWFFLDKNPLGLHPKYAYPESWDLPFEKKIIQRDKNKHGGYEYLRKLN